MHRGGAVLILTVLLLIHMALPCLAAEERGTLGVVTQAQLNGSRFGSGGEEKVLRIREVGGPVPPVLCAMGMVLSAYLIGIGYEKWHMRKRK